MKLVNMENHAIDIVLGAVCIIFLLVDTKLPQDIVYGLKSSLGKVIIGLILISIFYAAHPIVGVLSILVFWKLSESGIDMVEHVEKDIIPQGKEYARTAQGPEEKLQYNNSNEVVSSDIDGTLEEEVVSKMAPLKPCESGPSPENYSPVLDTSIPSSNL